MAFVSIVFATVCGFLHQLKWYQQYLDFLSYSLLGVVVWLFFLFSVDEGPKKNSLLVGGGHLSPHGRFVDRHACRVFFTAPQRGLANAYTHGDYLDFLPSCLLVRRLFANDAPFHPRTSDLVFIIATIALPFPLAYLQTAAKEAGTLWYIYFIIAQAAICYFVVVFELLNYRNFRERYAML